TTVVGAMYIVDPTIGSCSCFIGISGAFYKHQAVVVIKFQEKTSNFIDTFTIYDWIRFFYIAASMF
ncbi:17548_t:CDS:1, partial [Gigaspora margarita]